MNRSSIKGQRLGALFIIGCLLFNYPLLFLFNSATELLGIPLLYAYIFGVKRPIAHVMGYFTSVLRERIANFEAPHRRLDATAQPESAIPTPETATAAVGVSINDLRKNLRDINDKPAISLATLALVLLGLPVWWWGRRVR